MIQMQDNRSRNKTRPPLAETVTKCVKKLPIFFVIVSKPRETADGCKRTAMAGKEMVFSVRETVNTFKETGFGYREAIPCIDEMPAGDEVMAIHCRSYTNRRQRNEQRLSRECATTIETIRTDNNEMANGSVAIPNSPRGNANEPRGNTHRPSLKCGTAVKKWPSSLKQQATTSMFPRPQSENY